MASHSCPSVRFPVGLAIAALVLASQVRPGLAAGPYAAWKHGPPKDPNYFPIAVWLQAPRNAAKFQAAGINLYVGLWKGPTDKQLADLKAAGMPVICAQNDVGLKHADDPVILGWMHGDEPDNAQRRKDGKGYGPPVPPKKIVADYRRIRAADATRPVLLNLGQGVAWDGWVGRGVRTNHPEDYVEYVRGCDIASFDIYPAVSTRPQTAGKLWYVARGVERLRRWAGPKRITWNCIECTRISNVKVKPTPHQVRAEVWMAIVHGSRGLIYFVHQFKPRFIEPALLHDPEMVAAVTKINRQVRELAPVLNGPAVARIVHAKSPARPGGKDAADTADAGFTVRTSPADVPVDVLVQRHGGATYVLAVCMADAPVVVDFARTGGRDAGHRPVEVIGEDRRIDRSGGWGFREAFKPYDVHIYRLR